jgi:hypothetical protein
VKADDVVPEPGELYQKSSGRTMPAKSGTIRSGTIRSGTIKTGTAQAGDWTTLGPLPPSGMAHLSTDHAR